MSPEPGLRTHKKKRTIATRKMAEPKMWAQVIMAYCNASTILLSGK